MKTSGRSYPRCHSTEHKAFIFSSPAPLHPWTIEDVTADGMICRLHCKMPHWAEGKDFRLSGPQSLFLEFLFRNAATSTTNPVPMRSMVPGSGTGLGLSGGDGRVGGEYLGNEVAKGMTPEGSNGKEGSGGAHSSGKPAAGDMAIGGGSSFLVSPAAGVMLMSLQQ